MLTLLIRTLFIQICICYNKASSPILNCTVSGEVRQVRQRCNVEQDACARWRLAPRSQLPYFQTFPADPQDDIGQLHTVYNKDGLYFHDNPLHWFNESSVTKWGDILTGKPWGKTPIHTQAFCSGVVSVLHIMYSPSLWTNTQRTVLTSGTTSK